MEETEPEEEPSDPGYATPVSVETPLQSTVSRYLFEILYFVLAFHFVSFHDLNDTHDTTVLQYL